jgi:hypothetical protein
MAESVDHRARKRSSSGRPIQPGHDVERTDHPIGGAQQFPDSEKSAPQDESVSDVLSIRQF